MEDKHSPFAIFAIAVAAVCLGVAYFYSFMPTYVSFMLKNKILTRPQYNQDDNTLGWISSSLYNELDEYLTIRDYEMKNIKKTLIVDDETVTYLPLNHDYIRFVRNQNKEEYPYSSWQCSRTSVRGEELQSEYCVVTNIYYQSASDIYYFFQDPSRKNIDMKRDKFIASHGVFQVTIVDDIQTIKNLNLTAVLTRPMLVVHVVDSNYAHGFLEGCGPRFWTLAEFQSHASYIDPTKTQIYYTSVVFDPSSHNWANYQREPDGSYTPTRKWERMVQSMFSKYPLLTYRSFNGSSVMFQYMLFAGADMPRTASWGHNYLERKFKSYPLSTTHYRRAYLAYSEWILKNFNLPSKFQLTPIQKELQRKKLSENIPLCNGTCSSYVPKNISLDEFTGEWIVVLNRAGAGRREFLNADQLIDGLLRAFPDHKNPYLRVWPKQFNFGDDLYETALMTRPIRLLIGAHGAGLSNTLFMRPGAILYEVNPHGCRYLSFNFRRWAEAFSLQHSLWVPIVNENGISDDICNRESSITLNVKDIIAEVKGLLKDEAAYRNGYLRRALKIMTDLSIVDHPPPGFEKIL